MFDIFSSSYYVSTIVSVLTAVAAGGVTVYFVLSVWASSKYSSLKVSPVSQCDIDEFVDVNKNPPSTLKVVATSTIQLAGHQARSDHVIPLECTPSPHVDGLWVSRLAGSRSKSESKSGSKSSTEEQVVPVDDLLKRATKSKPTVVIATLRMGFGHHRLAYSATSWCLKNGYTTIFHDFLNVESEERDLMKSVDEFYSKMSRLASEWGGPVEKLWGMAMKQGDADGLRIAALTAAHLVPLLKAYPKDVPLITTHQVVALTAAAAGFTRVVNLVVDNYPQWFLVVPKVLNITQGPVNYQSFLKMGVPSDQLRLAGHWCPTELVHNIDVDCNRRIRRASESPTSKPRRLLVPVGGAGAQRAFIVNLIEALAGLVKDGQIQLFLNAGDHEHMKAAFVDVLTKCRLDYDTVTTTQGVRDFQSKLLNDDKTEPTKAITLFAFDEYFPAVATTDMLCRVADVLTCKPSELAFYPLPKLHIRRVGDHEADSARRAGEVGDGSMEAREISDAMRYIELFLQKPSDILISWNQAVMTNNKIGIYDGCKNAVAWAIEDKK